MREKTGRHMAVRITGAILAALVLLTAGAGAEAPAKERSPLIEAAFALLEEGNPFAARYEKLTGTAIETLFPWGVPYFFGGLSGAPGSGYFYFSYPDYHVHVCTKGSSYFKAGTKYFYGLDCSGFIRHVYRACKMPRIPNLSDILNKWEYRSHHLYDSREGHEAPPYKELKDTLQVGDLLVIRHEKSEYRHVMMYIGTMADFGYTAEEEPALAKWLEYPLVIHCGLSPFYGERFQKLIDEYPEKYGMATTTDGGVAISILGPRKKDAPEHGRVQKTNYAWFTMNDGGYQLTVVNMSDVKRYCWYRE